MVIAMKLKKVRPRNPVEQPVGVDGVGRAIDRHPVVVAGVEALLGELGREITTLRLGWAAGRRVWPPWPRLLAGRPITS